MAQILPNLGKNLHKHCLHACMFFHLCSSKSTPSTKSVQCPASSHITSAGLCNIPANACTNGHAHEHIGIGHKRKSEPNAQVARNTGQRPIVKSHDSQSQNLKTIKRCNTIVEALYLPTLCNLNPRSVYNKE